MAAAIWTVAVVCIALFGRVGVASASGYIRVEGDCRLEEAIRSANHDRAYGGCSAGYGADIIELSHDVHLDAPLPPVRSDITILGNGREIDGSQRYQILYVEAGASLALEHVVLSRGRGQDEGDLRAGSYKLGGAVFNLGSLRVHNSVFRDNYAEDGGGAILNNGSLRVSGSVFHNNSARFAGAIDNWSEEAVLHISDSEFRDNHVPQFGGALDNGGSATIEGSAFYGNSAGTGGAINNFTALAVRDSVFAGNSAAIGGAIGNSRDEATLEIRSSQFRQNQARVGGAVSVSAGYARLADSAFQANLASAAQGGSGDQIGGAVSIRSEGHISNSEFRDNYAGDYGGALQIRGQATIRFSYFGGNSAGDGGGAVYSLGEATLSQSVIRDSFAPAGGGLYIAGGDFRLRQSVLADNANGDCRVDPGRPGLAESRDNHISDGGCGARWRGAVYAGYCPPGQSRGGICLIGAGDAWQAAEMPAEEPTAPAQPRYAGIVVDARCSLADAIRAANDDQGRGGCRAGAGADRITLTRNLVLRGELPPIKSEIRLDGNGHSVSGAGSYRIFMVEAYGALELNDISLEDGWVADDGELNLIGDGAAVLNLGTLRINRSVVRGNRAGEDGGAIRNAGDLVVSGSSFLGNVADRQAGAIYSAEASGNPRAATLTIRDSEFNDNHSSRHGGAIFAEGQLTVIDSGFHANRAAVSGGAIYSLALASVRGSVFSENGAWRNGGAIYNDYKAHITIDESEFRGNAARGGGGALMTYGRASVTISDSVFHDNSAAEGGGLMAKGLASGGNAFYGELRLRYNYFAGNAGGDCRLGEYGLIRESDGNSSDGSCQARLP